ncbi:uncharacterized protein LOC124419940 [Lucilia cuprina]|uniref:uncharacterized protein LOC124419940 n=1 Tax=Lucilia cuprina TaxID=7375 RepID=UPI001F05C9EA|nr:uncharacterized protein LOC124419940 [Lucilia cuprina]
MFKFLLLCLISLIALVASRPSVLESHHAAYSPYYHTPLLTSSPYTALDAGVAAYHHGGFVSPLYGSHLSHVSPHISPYVASSSPYIGGHHYGLHPYDSLFLRH